MASAKFDSQSLLVRGARRRRAPAREAAPRGAHPARFAHPHPARHRGGQSRGTARLPAAPHQRGGQRQPDERRPHAHPVRSRPSATTASSPRWPPSLAVAAHRDLPQLDEKLYLDVFAPPETVAHAVRRPGADPTGAPSCTTTPRAHRCRGRNCPTRRPWPFRACFTTSSCCSSPTTSARSSAITTRVARAPRRTDFVQPDLFRSAYPDDPPF